MKFIKPFIMISLLLPSSQILAVDLENDVDKLSYTFGLDIGRSIMNQNEEINLDALFEAIRTVHEGRQPLMSEAEIQAFRTAYIQRKQAEAAEQQQAMVVENRAASSQFLAENRGRAGVLETDSGLQYIVERTGSGATPAATDSVTVHYRGSLLDGSEFDSSYSRNQPITFALNQVIPGWTEGVQLMQVGSKYKFFIPPELGYGDNGQMPTIPPASLLIFEVELLDIPSTE